VDVGDDRHVADVRSGLEMLGHVCFVSVSAAATRPRAERRQPAVASRAPRAVRATNLSRHPGSVIVRSPMGALQRRVVVVHGGMVPPTQTATR
ncbi:MAG: hypothetical protein ACRD3Q_17035, partial [Terriglobales bacterium]